MILLKQSIRILGLVLIFFLIESNISAQSDIIFDPLPTETTNFGFDVACSEEYLAISNPRLNFDKDTIGNGIVYVYYFENNLWKLKQSILPENIFSSNDGGFGYSVAMNDKILAIGDRIQKTVSIYTQDNNTWTLDETINFPDPNSEDRFDLSVTDDHVFLGLPNYELDQEGSGAVFVYDRLNAYSLSDTLFAENTTYLFGHRLVANNSELLVGSKPNGGLGGGAFLFKYENEQWQLNRIFSNDSEFNQGLVVDLDDEHLIVNGFKDGEDALEVFSLEDNEFIQSEITVSGLINTINLFNVSIGNIAEINSDNLFVTNGFGGIVSHYKKENSEYTFQGTLPTSFNDDFPYQIYLHGFSMDSNERFLFAGAPAYSDPLGGESTGAVFVYKYSTINSTKEEYPITSSFVSPNPCSNFISLRSEHRNDYLIGSVLNLAGSVIIPNVNNAKVDVSQLDDGVYLLELISRNKDEKRYCKFVKR